MVRCEGRFIASLTGLFIVAFRLMLKLSKSSLSPMNAEAKNIGRSVSAHCSLPPPHESEVP